LQIFSFARFESSYMKKLLFIFLTLPFGHLFAQSQTATSPKTPTFKFATLDKSPMDMAYFPVDYPVLKIQDKMNDPLIARVIYSRPQKDNRVIFGDLVEYNKVWRLGANEATEIEFYRDVKIKDKKLAKGRYTLYAIPTTDKWTIIFNKDTDIWGAFKYDDKKDVLRVDVPLQKTLDVNDAFSMQFNKTSNGMDLVIGWDDVLVNLPISLK
jgi:hypothetical protein